MPLRYAFRLLSLAIVVAIPFRGIAQGDTCTTALDVVSGVYSSSGPTSGSPGPSGCGGGTNGNWYRYTAAFNGAIVITSCHPLNNGLQFDTYLKVFTGDCDNLTCLGFNDDMNGTNCPNNAFASRMQVNVTAGQNYYIVWTNTFSSLPFTWELNECVGTATGVTYRDSNSNGARDPGEAHLPVMLLVQPGDHHVYSGNDPYSFCTDLGAHTITVPLPPLYHIAVPASQSFTINAQGDQITGMDFAFQPIPGIYDGAVNMWGWNPWIGNNTLLHINCSNIGTEPITPTIALTLDAALSFVSANVTPTSVNGQSITWSLPQLAPGANSNIQVTVFTAISTPPNAPISNSVVLSTAETDINPENNTDDKNGIATTSFDPNDKQVSATSISPDDVTDEKRLEYTIRFQNTGNAPAVNLVIKDSLDSDWDLNTFEMIGASHPFSLTVSNLVAIWTFANIMLPDSSTDELGSQGSIHYRMAPKNSLVLGDQLLNRADIYFDYNEPVLTNTTVTTVELTTAIAEEQAGVGMLVAPSPSNGLVNMRWNEAFTGSAELNVLDALGRVVFTMTIAGGSNSRSIDLSSLPAGSYIARLSGGKEAWARFVIQR